MAKSDNPLLSFPSTTGDTASSNAKPASSSLCQECKTTPFRYQCPRCSFRSCSLTCCLAHKKQTGCNGKRDRTKFLPVAHMDDNTLSSDYHFLEDVLGAVERAKRTAGKQAQSNASNKRFKPNNNSEGASEGGTHTMLQQIENLRVNNNNPASKESRQEDTPASIHQPTNHAAPSLPANCAKQLGPKWRHFWREAQLRGIHLLLMAPGMQRRKANTSHIKKDVITWKVDLRIHSSDPNIPPTIYSRKLIETSPLIPPLLPLVKQQHQQEESVHWLIQKLPSPSNRPCYLEILSLSDTLQSILKGLTIIEYPTMEVVPTSRLRQDFPRAIQEVRVKQEEVKL